MLVLDRKFVQDALDAYRDWDLANEVLYRLCADHPGHTARDAIYAKVWLIGRAYAAPVERRRINLDLSGDEFYKFLVDTIIDSKIDSWLLHPRDDIYNNRELNLTTHKKLIELLKPLTRLDKRSFASKYLHFHFQDRFFIYDARSATSVVQALKAPGGGARREMPARLANVDEAYETFVGRCEQLSLDIRDQIDRHPTPREVDKILLHWNEHTRPKAKN